MSYYPDVSAAPSGTDFTRQLSSRDLGSSIPIPFVTAAGVFLTPACFPGRQYHEAAAAKCFSNLLAVGFHRFEVDLYWDVSRQIWSLCPVELGSDGAAPGTSSSVIVSVSASSTTSVISGSPSDAARAANLVRTNVRDPVLERAATTTSATTKASVSRTSLSDQPLTTAATSTSTNAATTGTQTSASDSPTTSGPVIDVGPYSCSESLNLGTLLDILAGHLDATSDDLHASLITFIFNIQAAASASDPTGSPRQPAPQDLPGVGRTLGSVLSNRMSSYIYTPKELQANRAHVESTWFVPSLYQPDSAYFILESSGDARHTPDGWPDESWLLMEAARRLLIGFGRIDPQMAGYDAAADGATMFDTDYLQMTRSLTLDSQGRVTSGCYYTDGVYSVAETNSSWAVPGKDILGPRPADLSADLAQRAGRNIANCGTTPLLNATLQNFTAAQNYTPYREFVQSTIWSWAAGQPLSTTEAQGLLNRCAALNATSGHWEVAGCEESHYAACQRSGRPNEWNISSAATTYEKAGLLCPGGTIFAAPRTAVQNLYLLAAWRDFVAAHPADAAANGGDDLLWLDFNDLDENTCWVVGQNTTCPYLVSDDSDREIIVPTVAAIVVFVLAALLLFVKCAANRQRSRRWKRRGSDGWDYEGVPS